MFYVFDDTDYLKVTLAKENVISGNMHEVLNGDFNLTFSIPLEESKGALVLVGYSVAYQTLTGAYQLFQVVEIQDDKDSMTKTFNCRHAFYELRDYMIEHKDISDSQTTYALTQILTGTRFALGSVDASTALHNISINHKSVLEAFTTFLETWAVECSFTFTITGSKIQTRAINIHNPRGSDNGRRIEFGKDLLSVQRTVNTDELKTAIIGIGKIENPPQGQSDELYFTNVVWTTPTNPLAKPAGQNWLEDPTSRDLYGYQWSGAKQNRFAIYESEETDPAKLLQKTYDLLMTLNKPQITYVIKVVDLAKIYGANLFYINIGDTVTILDDVLKVQVKARLLERNENLLNDLDTDLVFGTFVDNFTSAGSNLGDRVSDLEGKVGEGGFLKAGDTIDFDWLEDMMVMNNQMLVAGKGSVTITDNDGIMIEADPVNKMGGALQLKGGIFAIASDYDFANGRYNWRTFGTGTGFSADEIDAGTLQGINMILGGQGGGVLTLYDENGEIVVNLGGQGAGFTFMKADMIYDAKNIMYASYDESPLINQDDPADQTYDIYVDGEHGDNNNSGAKGFPVQSIQNAIDMLPKQLNHNVNVWITPYLYSETVQIAGFSGYGNITLKTYIPPVRYIRDTINGGNTVNAYAHWVEVKGWAVGSNTNLASGKPVTTNSADKTNIAYVTDDITNDSTKYFGANNANAYVEVDLGSNQEMKYVHIWHYYSDNRTYKSEKTTVTDGVTTWTVYDSAWTGDLKSVANGKKLLPVIRGRIQVLKTTNFVQLQDLRVIGDSYSIISSDYNCYCYIYYCFVTGTDGSTDRVLDNAGGRMFVEQTEFNQATNYGIATHRCGHSFVVSCRGGDYPNGIYVYYGGITGMSGTTPDGRTNESLTGVGSLLMGTATPTAGDYTDLSATPPKPPAPTQYTKTWNSTGSGSYRGTSWDTGKVAQGEWSNYGLNEGMWFFGSTLKSTISGKTIVSARIYVTRNNSSGTSSSQTATFRPHNYATRPAGNPVYVGSKTVTAGFAWGEGKWVTITTLVQDIASGTASGIGIYTSSNSPYMAFSTTAKIEVTYK